MIIFLISLFVSIIPAVLIILWLKKRKKDDPLYEKSCNFAIKTGAISVLPIIVVSGVLFVAIVILRLALFPNMNQLVYKAIYSFIVLAFAEEIVKFFCLKILLKNKFSEYSWVDVVAFMAIIGASFGVAEDIIYAIGSTPIMMIVRGITMGHIGYGFIMGWLYGKRLYTGKKIFGVLAVLIPFILHGIYDYSLTQELIELNDNIAIVGVSMAFVDIVLVILMIRFFIRTRKKEQYNKPLIILDSPADS